jgi:hypothetical protein
MAIGIIDYYISTSPRLMGSAKSIHVIAAGVSTPK